MVQLYIDSLIDCLSQKQQVKLEIREDPNSGMIVINNSTTIPINTLNDAI